MEENYLNQESENLESKLNNQRPEILTVFLILSFIFSGLMSLFSLIGFFMIDKIYPLFLEQVPQLADVKLSDMKLIIAFVVIVWLMSLIGAILMFFMRKAGFYIYIIPNGLLFIAQLMELTAGFNGITLMFLAISGLFIFVYAKHLNLIR